MEDPKHPLVGYGVYDYGEGAKGTGREQAEILAVFPSGSVEGGDIAVLQYFGWGYPRRLVPVTELTNTRWELYEDVKAMKARHDQDVVRQKG
jgi:hypothetical protein